MSTGDDMRCSGKAKIPRKGCIEFANQRPSRDRDGKFVRRDAGGGKNISGPAGALKIESHRARCHRVVDGRLTSQPPGDEIAEAEEFPGPPHQLRVVLGPPHQFGDREHGVRRLTGDVLQPLAANGGLEPGVLLDGAGVERDRAVSEDRAVWPDWGHRFAER